MIKITIYDKNAFIFTPYHPDFVKKIKGIGGAWWYELVGCWVIPEEAVASARKIMIEVYGYSDITENETLSLKITFNECISVTKADVVLYGKVLAHGYGRDRGARVGDDVAFISGGAASGGSRKNRKSIVKKGSVAILSNVNKNIYENTETGAEVTVEVIDTETGKQELLEEKERLLKRIEEIDRLLMKAV